MATNETDFLDKEVVESLVELGNDVGENVISKMIRLFDDSFRSLTRDMEASIESGDFEKMRRAAHTLKSSSGNLGAMGLSEICKALESSAREGSLDGAKDQIAELKSGYESVSKKLEVYHNMDVA